MRGLDRVSEAVRVARGDLTGDEVAAAISRARVTAPPPRCVLPGRWRRLRLGIKAGDREICPWCRTTWTWCWWGEWEISYDGWKGCQ